MFPHACSVIFVQLQELDKEAAVQKIWAVYAAWHNPFGEEQTVIRYARKTMEEADKQTWPLPFETEGSTFSVVLVLRDCGWSVSIRVCMHCSSFFYFVI